MYDGKAGNKSPFVATINEWSLIHALGFVTQNVFSSYSWEQMSCSIVWVVLDFSQCIWFPFG